MWYLSNLIERLKNELYCNYCELPPNYFINKSKSAYSQKPFASIKGRTRKEIVDDAIEAIKKCGCIRTGVGAMVKNVYDDS